MLTTFKFLEVLPVHPKSNIVKGAGALSHNRFVKVVNVCYGGTERRDTDGQRGDCVKKKQTKCEPSVRSRDKRRKNRG